MSEYKEKEEALKEEMQKDLEKLQAQMEIARYDYETEMLRERKLINPIIRIQTPDKY